MKKSACTVVGVFASLALTGCGGGNSATVTPPTDAERIDANNAMFDRLDAKFNTAFTGMPTTGSATYTGYAVAKHTDGVSDDMALLGDASIQANFATSAVSGQATNFAGYHNNGADGTYVGSVALTGGVIGINRPNDLDTFFNGTLTRDGDTLVVDGYAIGDFKGTPIAGVLLGIDDTTSTVTINGGAPLPIYGGFHGEN